MDALVADLESVDAVEEEVGPLRDLAARLAPLSRPVAPAEVELRRLRERALAVLGAFAAGGEPAPEPAKGPDQGPDRNRGPEFWKR